MQQVQISEKKQEAPNLRSNCTVELVSIWSKQQTLQCDQKEDTLPFAGPIAALSIQSRPNVICSASKKDQLSRTLKISENVQREMAAQIKKHSFKITLLMNLLKTWKTKIIDPSTKITRTKTDEVVGRLQKLAKASELQVSFEPMAPQSLPRVCRRAQ